MNTVGRYIYRITVHGWGQAIFPDCNWNKTGIAEASMSDKKCTVLVTIKW